MTSTDVYVTLELTTGEHLNLYKASTDGTTEQELADINDSSTKLNDLIAQRGGQISVKRARAWTDADGILQYVAFKASGSYKAMLFGT